MMMAACGWTELQTASDVQHSAVVQDVAVLTLGASTWRQQIYTSNHIDSLLVDVWSVKHVATEKD